MKKYVLFLFLACGYTTPVKPKAEKEDYRLPAFSVEVDHYDLVLTLGEEIFKSATSNTFEGEVTIVFKNKNATSEIRLHANKITINAGSDVVLEKVVNEAENQVIALTNTNFESDTNTDILVLTAGEALEVDASYSLKIKYTALMRTNEMYGFYKSSYPKDNNEVFLGTTQFQPTHARKAFPCFDEPIYKAVFKISIRHPSSLTALSNTKGTATVETETTYTVTTFEPTPKMSTYLVAFIVSDFTCTESAGSTTHRVCSRSDTASLRTTALAAGPKLITALEGITGIQYLSSQIGKMDQVAIPDFSAGAMENWGLITYRETGLLWDQARSSNSYLQSITNVISHEITHMWFGNLVTCHWWKDTFLNEGFARLYQYFGTAKIDSAASWELDKQFVTAQVHPMLVTDAQTTAKALSHDVFTQAEISDRFTSVSYNKGASVLRMLQQAIKEENFNRGLNDYLSTNEFGSTTPEDLWTALQKQVQAGALPDGTTLATVAENWVKEPGFPLLTVQQSGTKVEISQARFLSTGTHDATKKWYVPITYTLSSEEEHFDDTTTRAWLLPSEKLTIDVPEGTEWIILNNKQTGYYRVQYDDALFAKIEQVLKTNLTQIGEINRAHLVDDVYNLAKIGTYSYTKLFEFFLYLEKEVSYYPWNAAITAFSSMLQRTGNEKIRASISQYILTLIKNLYASVPFDEAKDDNQIYTFNRVQAVTWACRLENQECVTKAVAAFQKYKTDGTEVDKNLKSSIYCNGLRHSASSTEDWSFLWGKYSETQLASEKVTIISALGCSRDQTVLENYLQMSINKTSGIRQQDALSVFSSVYTQNPEGVGYALNFLLQNHKAIAEYYGSMNSLNNLFSGLAGRFTLQTQVDQLKKFITDNSDLEESVKSAAERAVENAENNLRLIAEFEKELSVYFNLNTADSLRIGGVTMVGAIFVVLYQLWF